MITVECMYCHRSHQKEGETADGGISHGLCARCQICRSDLRDFFSREEQKENIEKEIDSGVNWIGEDKVAYSEEDQKVYNELLAEVLGERGDGKRL